jgi:hypothetical protein
VLSTAVAAVCVVSLWAQAAKDTAAAAATRKALQTKVSVDYKETTLEDIKADLTKKVKAAGGGNLKIQVDNSGGVSNITLFTFKAKDQPVTAILDKMFAKTELGYIVISGSYRTYKKHDGYLLIVKGPERGYPAPPPKDK